MDVKRYVIGLLELAAGDIEEMDPESAVKRIRAAIRALQSDDIKNEIFDIAAEVESAER